MNKLFTCISVLLLSLSYAGWSLANQAFVTTDSGLEYKELKLGGGKKAQTGDVAVIHFRGWLNDNGRKGKEIFDTRKQNRTVSFKIGTGKVMQGWNEGVTGMQAGGMRMLRVPPELAYGEKSVEKVIPARAHLIFLMELLELK